MAEWRTFQVSESKKPGAFRAIDGLNLYSNVQEGVEELATSLGGAIINFLSDESWNGLNIKPPMMHFSTCDLLGNVHERSGTPVLSFELRDKPYSDNPSFLSQHLVVSHNPSYAGELNENFTFDSVFCPEMNEFYGRETLGFSPDEVRSEPNGLGFVVGVGRDHLNVYAREKKEMAEKLFSVFGLKIEPSQSGKIAKQIHRQMGGSQGSRIFKISGVRNLISECKPDKWISRGEAAQKISGGR